MASDLGDIASNLSVDGDGCAVAATLTLIGFIIGGLFLAVGGAPMLLEAAFEAAFAGIVVMRPISGNLVLGGWKLRLLQHTWRKALLGLVLLVALAAWLQHRAPAATTLAQAFCSVGQPGSTPHN